MRRRWMRCWRRSGGRGVRVVAGGLTPWPAAAREVWAYKSIWQSPRRALLAPGDVAHTSCFGGRCAAAYGIGGKRFYDYYTAEVD